MSRSPAAFRLLEAGVPLSLLLDLADPAGPDSAEIMRVEAIDADLRREVERQREPREKRPRRTG